MLKEIILPSPQLETREGKFVSTRKPTHEIGGICVKLEVV